MRPLSYQNWPPISLLDAIGSLPKCQVAIFACVSPFISDGWTEGLEGPDEGAIKQQQEGRPDEGDDDVTARDTSLDLRFTRSGPIDERS